MNKEEKQFWRAFPWIITFFLAIGLAWAVTTLIEDMAHSVDHESETERLQSQRDLLAQIVNEKWLGKSKAEITRLLIEKHIDFIEKDGILAAGEVELHFKKGGLFQIAVE